MTHAERNHSPAAIGVGASMRSCTRGATGTSPEASAVISPHDAAIIAGLKAGDPGVVGRVRRWVEITVRHWCRHQRMNDPDDLSSEIVLEVWRTLHAGRFRGRSALRSYVVGIARNLLKRHASKRRSNSISTDPPPPEPGPGPDEGLMKNELRDRVRAALQRLPDECVQLFDWVYEEGWSSEMVGRCLGVNPGTARVRLHRCAEKFREVWRDIDERFGVPAAPMPIRR